MQYIWDKDYIEARERFIQLRDNGGLDEAARDPASEAGKAVGKIMNHHEIIAIGINQGRYIQTGTKHAS